MHQKPVIARGFGGKPLNRVALQHGNGLIYISTERAVKAVETGDIPAIGFPAEDVFDFDSAAFAALTEEWENRGQTLPDTWAGLKRFRWPKPSA